MSKVELIYWATMIIAAVAVYGMSREWYSIPIVLACFMFLYVFAFVVNSGTSTNPNGACIEAGGVPVSKGSLGGSDCKFPNEVTP